SSINSAPTGRQRTTAPGTTCTCVTTSTSQRIAIGGQCLRDEAVIPRIKHGRVQEAIDHERARGFVELVFHRRAAEWNLDEGIEVLRRIRACRNRTNVHRPALA